ncbi:MAG: ABC transporter ATP-binding protein [Gemmatimonadetes bacterium]|nr:ABC transporter ATP-binding protein [Gemmatimonadota bacterium]MYB07558.1 ABC transporter ATP-binding protein [Gemmatimonadota bacterium]MYE17247.1 ABC transporter ATP-binding protein [Gemmatimonadota bacterium]MYG23146.1 ABC transporter ATP-binding protein [Gemmatimonadota bacterium]MYJ38584.1 ABC transporter ATP-binding protein [Gemmatimonadota bacterium]
MIEAAARSAVLEVRGLRRSYTGVSGPDLHILRGVNLTLDRGEAVAIVGASGSGKSTLLHLLGALDRPTAGTVLLDGIDIGTLGDEEAASIRNMRLGFVFQFHHLLLDFTALENVMVPALIQGESFAGAKERAAELLGEVGLEDRLGHKPGELSGGEQQRVAVARALVNHPLVILADEPTGNLDNDTSEQVQETLFALRDRYGVALVVVTHNRQLAARAERVLRLGLGVLEDV